MQLKIVPSTLQDNEAALVLERIFDHHTVRFIA